MNEHRKLHVPITFLADVDGTEPENFRPVWRRMVEVLADGGASLVAHLLYLVVQPVGLRRQLAQFFRLIENSRVHIRQPCFGLLEMLFGIVVFQVQLQPMVFIG